MSLAFSAVLIFLIFAPGAILRRSYLSGRFSKKFIYSSAIDEVIWAIIPGTLLHLMMIFFTQAVTDYRVDFSTLGLLLVGAKEDANTLRVFNILGRDILQITEYNLILWFCAISLGHGSRLLVQIFQLDLRFDFLRFNNEWYYLLSGEGFELPAGIFEIRKRAQYDVWINALIETSNGSVLYSGLLEDFYLSRAGGLESIYLTQVARRYLDEERTGQPQRFSYYDVPGDLFVIKYSQVVNLNILYYEALKEVE
jgi:hypothetical protein